MKGQAIGSAFPVGKAHIDIAKAISSAAPGKPPGIPFPETVFNKTLPDPQCSTIAADRPLK